MQFTHVHHPNYRGLSPMTLERTPFKSALSGRIRSCGTFSSIAWLNPVFSEIPQPQAYIPLNCLKFIALVFLLQRVIISGYVRYTGGGRT